MNEERTGDEQSEDVPSERNKPIDHIEAFKRIQRVIERVDPKFRQKTLNAISILYEG